MTPSRRALYVILYSVMICSKCGKAFPSGQLNSVDVARSPSEKESIKDGTFFLHKCSDCGTVSLNNDDPFVYHDSAQKILIVLSQTPISSPGLEGYTCRLVGSVGELIEKINIFDAGLDDIAIEICKFVTLQEIKKNVPLKFYRADGTDGELTLAYPEKEEMQMLQIGQNIYNDAIGILSRNPEIRRAAEGLVKVDQDWLCRFFK